MPSRARWRRSPARRAGWCRGARRSPCRRGCTAARRRARRAPVRRGRRSGGRGASAARPLTVELVPVTSRAPLESWQVGPWNRWAYVHVDEMVPTVAVGRGDAVRELPRGGEEVFEDYEGDFWRYDVACGWHPPREGAEAETVLDFLPTIGPAQWRHGERMHYATPNTDLLGVAADRAGGAPLAELISRELWAPAGAERDARLTVDGAGTATIGGGYCATLRDYARLGMWVLEGPADALGRGDASAFEQITTPEVRAGADGYGNQWWRRDGALMARGIHGQLIAADPDSRTVVVLLSSWPDAVDPQREAAQRAVVARARS